MKEFILENLTNDVNLNVMNIVLNNLVALIASFFIMFVYKLTHSGVNYNKKLNLSLGSIIIITTMIMGVISNNVALSLGMVGALSIIRFRTAVKDIRDATYIFWAIAVGIGCGVSQYVLVGIGSITLFIFMILTKQSAESDLHLLVIHHDLKSQNQVEIVVNEYFDKKACQTIKNATVNGCELVYKVNTKVLRDANSKHQIDIVQKLLKVDGVTRVNLLEQQDDISR
jgi:uncharacterized membrane protein YhiD involved in acid resistance